MTDRWRVSLALALHADGVTIDATGEPVTRGIVVGGAGLGLKAPAGTPVFSLWESILQWLTSQLSNDPHDSSGRAGGPGPGQRALNYGAWKDAATGEVYFDAVDVLTDVAEALLLAHARGEIAVYDLDRQQEVRL